MAFKPGAGLNVEREIVTGLKAGGVVPGDTVLVHSSFKSFGLTGINPDSIIKGLLTAVGREGNLLFPALTYENVTKANPVFDVDRTVSCVGFLAEYFRTSHAQMRSIHPTHSVAGTGKDIKALLDGHIRDNTPCGPHSPYRRLYERNGKIIMIGCGLKPNTCMHAVEETVKPLYLLGEMVNYTIITGQDTFVKEYRVHDFKDCAQRYDRVATAMPAGGIRKVDIFRAETYVIDCRAMWDSVALRLRDDPWFLVDRLDG